MTKPAKKPTKPTPKPKRYTMTWRNKWLTSDAKTAQDMVDTMRAAAAELAEMAAAGVALNPDSGIGDDYAELVTTDPEVAKRYGLREDENDYDGLLDD